MNTATAWQAGEHCPDCDAPLTLADDGTGPIRLDCGSCGYVDARVVYDRAGGGGR